MNELSVIGSLCCLERDLRLSREKGKNKEIKENFKRLSWVYCATNTVTISGIATEQTLQVARRKYTVKGYFYVRYFRRRFIMNRFRYCWYKGTVRFCLNDTEICNTTCRLTFLQVCLCVTFIVLYWHGGVVSKFLKLSNWSPGNNTMKPHKFYIRVFSLL